MVERMKYFHAPNGVCDEKFFTLDLYAKFFFAEKSGEHSKNKKVVLCFFVYSLFNILSALITKEVFFFPYGIIRQKEKESERKKEQCQ